MTVNRLTIELKVLLLSVLLKSIFLGQLMSVIMSARWCPRQHPYYLWSLSHSASFSLQVHGLNSISSLIKVPACVHLDWILRSGGEGGPQPSCISSTHDEVCLSLVFFHFSCCCNFYHFLRLDICLTQSFFCFPAVWAGRRWCEGWVSNCDHDHFKAIIGKCMTNDIFKQLYHRKDLKSWLQPSLPTNQLTVENWQVSIGSAFKKRGVKYLCCSILDTQVHISHLSVLVHHRII